MRKLKFLLILIPLFSFMTNEKKYSMLCLGDSYTIGEAVDEQERFPMQAVELLKQKGTEFSKPEIIAKTGWTTDELAAAIKEKNLSGTYDCVTLLIGVNNQYRERDLANYRKEFEGLLETAIKYANGKHNHVFVVSIPDWGVTPFVASDGKHRTGEQIGKEIDQFNAVNKEEALKAKVNYVDITPGSKEAKFKHELIATDGLHPSGKMYADWAKLLEEKMKSVYPRK